MPVPCQDTATGQPEWALVSTGMLGTRQHFVPLREAGERGNDIQVPYTKDHIKAARGAA